MRKLFTLLLLVLFFAFSSNNASAQMSPTDISKVNIDELTDEQIQELLNRAESQNLTQKQMEDLAIQKGMPASEVTKLRNRIEKIKSKPTKSGKDNVKNRSRYAKDDTTYPYVEKTTVQESDADMFNDLEKQSVRPEDRIFGFSLFNKKKLAFEPNLNIATPQNYVLGADDEIFIDIWGASQETYEVKISPDGTIFIDNLGIIVLNGFTIEEATVKLRKALSKIYSGLNAGNTFLKVSLGTVRSIKVNIVGDVYKPGTYTIPSLATAFNALYVAGGPSINGTLRNVKVIRSNKVIAELDFYDFLLKGEQKDNIRLQDQDVLFVSPYINRVELKGQIKRPFFYDLLEKETLSDLITYAGGFTGKAYSERMQIIRKNGKEHQMVDVEYKYSDSLLLANGDLIVVDSILPGYRNRVGIKGALWRPGFFSIDNKLTLKGLIEKAEGLRGDAFKNRVSIYRTRGDYSMEMIAVDLNKLYSDSTDIDLIKDDIVIVPSIFELKEEYVIKVEGEVRIPGQYLYIANSSIEDIILQAGGLLQSASMARVEVARRIKNPYEVTVSENIAEVYQFPITKDLKLSTEAKQFTLEPFDHVFIRRSPSYEAQNIVTLDGEFLFPGRYALNNKNERISDIISRAGGLSPEAFPKGAKLVRSIPKDQDWRKNFIDTMSFSNSMDSVKFFLNFASVSSIGIDLDQILAKPKSKYDLILQDNDILQVTKELQTVHLSGEILSPVLVRYERGKSLRHYLSSAGGFTSEAKKGKVYIVYANGIMDRTRTIFFFKNYPKVEPGAEIVVPKKVRTKGMNTGEIVALSSTLISAMSVVAAIILSR